MRSSKRQVLFNKPDSVLRLSGSNKSITGGTLVEGCTSSRTYIDTDGMLKTAAANVPVWENGGMRHEPAGTNLALYSENQDVASWGGAGGTVTADTSNSPFGTQTVDDFVENTATSVHGYATGSPNRPLISGIDIYTLSAYFDLSVSAPYIVFGVVKTVTSDQVGCTIDVANKTISGSGVVGTANVLNSAKIARLANTNLYLVDLEIVVNVVGTYILTARCATASTFTTLSPSFLGSSKNLKIWGVDLKIGKKISYIPTTTAAASIATCALSIPLVLNQNFFQKSAIVMRVRAKWANSATAKSWLTPSTTAEGLIDNGSGALTFVDSAANTATADLTSWAADTIITVAIVTDNVTGLMSLSASKDNGVTWLDSADTAFSGLTVGANWLLFSANTQVFECLGWNVIKSNKGFAQMKAYAKANALRLTQ
jgi:hypothetical protein